MRRLVLPLVLFLALLCSPSLALRLAPLANAVSGAVAAGAGDRIAIVGGIVGGGPSGSVAIYDTANYGNVTTTSLQYPVTGHAVGGAVGSNGNSAWVVAYADMPGTIAAQLLQYVLFDPATNITTGSILGAGGAERRGAACAGSDDDGSFDKSGYIVVAGGMNGSDIVVSDVLILLAGDMTVIPGKNLTVARAYAKVAALDGIPVSSIPVEVWCYHNGNSDWVSRTVNNVNVHPPLWRHAIGIALNDPSGGQLTLRTFVAGGSLDAAGTSLSKSVFMIEIDPTQSSTNGNVTVHGYISNPRADLCGGCSKRSCVFAGGLVNGPAPTTDAMDIVPIYSTLPVYSYNMSTPLQEMACATALETGVFVVAGGIINDVGLTPTNEVFAVGALQPVGIHNFTARYGLAAATTQGRYVLIGGGCTQAGYPTSCSAISSVEAFDIFTLQFVAPIADLKFARGFLSAISANNITIFAGGANESTKFDTYDIYDGFTPVPTGFKLRSRRSDMATAYANNKYFFAGGITTAGYTVDVDVLTYTPGIGIGLFGNPGVLYPARAYAAAAYSETLYAMIFTGGAYDFPGTGVYSSTNYFNFTFLAMMNSSQQLSQARRAIAAFSPGDGSAHFYGGDTVTPDQNLTPSGIVDSFIGGSFIPTPLYADTVAESVGASLPYFKAGVAAGESFRSIFVYEKGHQALQHMVTARTYHFVVGVQGYVVCGGGINASQVINNIEVFSLGGIIPTITIAPGGTTQPPPSSGPSCAGSPPLAGAVCVGGVWLVPNTTSTTTITIGTNQTVVVNGSLILLPETVTVIYATPGSGAPIVVSGSILIDGTLTIVLGSQIVDGAVIPIVSASGSGEVNGTWTAVNIDDQNSGCDKVKGTVQPELNGGLSVLLSVENKRCGLSKGAIAGIAVGAFIFVALVVALVLCVWWRCSKQHTLFHARTKGETGWR